MGLGVPHVCTNSENSHLGLSENSVPLNPMVLLIIIPMKNGPLFHWEYTTQHFQTNPSGWSFEIWSFSIRG